MAVQLQMFMILSLAANAKCCSGERRVLLDVVYS